MEILAWWGRKAWLWKRFLMTPRWGKSEILAEFLTEGNKGMKVIVEKVCSDSATRDGPNHCASTRQNFVRPEGNGSETACGSLVKVIDATVCQFVGGKTRLS